MVSGEVDFWNSLEVTIVLGSVFTSAELHEIQCTKVRGILGKNQTEFRTKYQDCMQSLNLFLFFCSNYVLPFFNLSPFLYPSSLAKPLFLLPTVSSFLLRTCMNYEFFIWFPHIHPLLWVFFFVIIFLGFFMCVFLSFQNFSVLSSCSVDT